MFAVNTYEEIERKQREIPERQIIILLFVRPTAPEAKEIIKEFNYIHYNSERYCSIYAVGYTNDFKKETDENYTPAGCIGGTEWYFSNLEFVKFKNNLEERIRWRYSGEVEMIILQSNPGGHQILNFQNYVAIDINYGIRCGYIDSFSRFMESLIRSSKSEITAKSAIRKANRYSLRTIISDTIDSCKKVPRPLKSILQDRLFYTGAIHNKKV